MRFPLPGAVIAALLLCAPPAQAGAPCRIPTEEANAARLGSLTTEQREHLEESLSCEDREVAVLASTLLIADALARNAEGALLDLCERHLDEVAPGDPVVLETYLEVVPWGPPGHAAAAFRIADATLAAEKPPEARLGYLALRARARAASAILFDHVRPADPPSDEALLGAIRAYAWATVREADTVRRQLQTFDGMPEAQSSTHLQTCIGLGGCPDVRFEAVEEAPDPGE